MATLKEILRELEVIIEDMEEFIETTHSDNLASDLNKDVLTHMESAANKLDGIIDDVRDGIYEEDKDDMLFEEDDY